MEAIDTIGIALPPAGRIQRLCRLQPRTVGVLSAKAAALNMALDVDYWDGEDFIEYGLPVADLARLAVKTVRS